MKRKKTINEQMPSALITFVGKAFMINIDSEIQLKSEDAFIEPGAYIRGKPPRANWRGQTYRDNRGLYGRGSYERG